jgi:hypothetical protein
VPEMNALDPHACPAGMERESEPVGIVGPGPVDASPLAAPAEAGNVMSLVEALARRRRERFFPQNRL